MDQKPTNLEQGGNISQNDLKEIFTIQYNDLFNKLIKKSLEEFIYLLKQQIILHLRIIDKQCDSSLLSNFYKKYQNISKNEKIRIIKIFNELGSFQEKNLVYLNILDIYVHCPQCKEAIHKCGNKLVIFENYFFCIKCKKVYNSNHIKLFCKECKKTYLTTKRTALEKKNNYFYSTSYIKYHCLSENEEKIKCLNCENDLYYNININTKGKEEKGIKDIFCIKCKLIFDTKEIFFTCKICGENFKAEPQIYRNFPSIKKYLLLLIHTFRKNIYALPDIITNKKCNCDLNGIQYFLHKDNGRLYEGNKNGKSVIICDHCYGIFKNENFNWNCPLCGGSFKGVKKYKNMKFDKKKKKISATNTNIKMLNINTEEKNKNIRKVNLREHNIQNSTNHTFYNSIAYSNEENNNFEPDSLKKLNRDFSLTTKRENNSQEKQNREEICNIDKGLVIKTVFNKKNNTSFKKNNKNDCSSQKISEKSKNIKPAQLFKSYVKENKGNMNDLGNKIYEKKEYKRSISYLNKNKKLNNFNENPFENINQKKRAISFKKIILSEGKPLFKIKEFICEESLENISSEKKNLIKFKANIENVIPKNLFLKKKNNNFKNNNISININNNLIQLSCSPNIKTDNKIQKSKIINKNISPDVKSLNNSSSSKIFRESGEQNILIHSSKEIFKTKNLEISSEIKENRLKGNSAQKIIYDKKKINEEKEKITEIETINNIILNQNKSIKNKKKKFKKIKKKGYIGNKGETFNKEQINNKFIKEENKKIIRNEINNEEKNEIQNINSEKKPNMVTRLSLINPEEKYPQSIQIKKINKIKINAKKNSDNQINKSKNIKIVNTSKNSNPNVFIITNLSKNSISNVKKSNIFNPDINNDKNVKSNERYLNLTTNDNSNFVYIIPKSRKNKNVKGDNTNKKENEDNPIKNNNQIKQNKISIFINYENNNLDNKKDNGTHKKNNLSFHINNINEIKNINSIKKDIITINNKKKQIIIQNNINSPLNIKNNNKKKVVKKKQNFQINNINSNNNFVKSIEKSNNEIENEEKNNDNKILKKINVDNKINNIGKNLNNNSNNGDNNEIPNNINLNNNDNLNNKNIKYLNIIHSNEKFLKLKIYFSSFEQEIVPELPRRLSFDIGFSKNYFSLLTNSENFELKTFDSNYYTILRQIGKGSYGKIYLVEDPKTKEQFALKKIIIGDSLELKENQDEYKLTWKLTKSNPELKIVKKYAIEIKKLDKYNLVMYVLMEIANCDWEQELINRHKDNAFYTEIELIEILKSLVNTLAELQKRGISHRDIKPQNILCFGKEGYKLSDFGEAKTKNKNFFKSNNFEENTSKQTVRGTELYMSPILFKALQMNCINGAKYNAYKSDVFSLGMCFLLASSLNYQSLYEIREIYDMEVLKGIVKKYLSNYSKNYINLIINMLQINEKLRPDFIELNSMIV